MRFQAGQKWLRYGASLALFAVLALLVSPAFAGVCCCESFVPETVPTVHSCCAPAGPTAHLTAPEDCHCDLTQSVVAATPERADQAFVSPVFVTAAPVFAFQVRSVQRVSYVSAQELKPKPPDPFSSRGRAPPVFLAV